MKICFDSIEEIKTFVAGLKGTRGGKKDDGEAGDANTTQTGTAPPPMQPPAGQPQGFNPQPQGFAPQTQPGFNPAGFAPQGQQTQQPGYDPVAAGLAQRISQKIDWALMPAPQGGGQAADATLSWFRGACAKGGLAEATNATLDQIKQHFLPRLPVPALEEIAKLMNA